MFSPEALWTALSSILNPDTLLSRGDVRFCVAYSGGLDSHVLLHAMAVCRQLFPRFNIKVRACHVNHNCQPDSKAWEQHAKQQCEVLHIPLSIRSLHFSLAPGQSFEAMARTHRYRIFEEILLPDEYLLTAHHQEDQAETLLLQLLRGAGVKGLSAMPAKKSFASGFLLRPLLSFSQADLNRYAEKQALKWVEDTSNRDLSLNRNYLRHCVWPLLRERWPEAAQVISRSAMHCAEADQFLTSLAGKDLETIKEGRAIHLSQLLQLSPERQCHAVREWIRSAGFLLPSFKQWNRIYQTVILARADRNPQLTWGDACIRRYRNYLYLFRKEETSSRVTEWCQSWDFLTPLLLPNAMGTLVAEKNEKEGLSSAISESQIQVRFRQGGERIRLPGRLGTHTLKKLMQEWGIPPWQRDQIPLLYVDNELAMVVGHAIACDFLSRVSDKENWQINWLSSNRLAS